MAEYTQRERAKQEANKVPSVPAGGEVGVVANIDTRGGFRSVNVHTSVSPYRQPYFPTRMRTPLSDEGRYALANPGTGSMYQPVNRVTNALERRAIGLELAKYQVLSQADRAERNVNEARARAAAQEGAVPRVSADRLQERADAFYGSANQVTDEERDRYSQENIDYLNMNVDDIPGIINTGAGDLRPEEAAAQAEPWTVGLVDYQTSSINDMFPYDAATPADYRGPLKNMTLLATKHPTVFQAAAAAGLSPVQVAAATNLVLANDAADEILTTQNVFRQRQILDAQGTEAQKALVLAIIDDRAKEAQRAFAEKSETGSMVQAGAAAMFNATAGTLFDWLFRAAENTTRGVLTIADLRDAAGRPNEGVFDTFRQAWNAVAPGYIPAERITMLRNKHGQLPTDLVLEAVAARNAGESDVVGHMYESYADNPEALQILDQVFFDRNTDQGIRDLVDEVLAEDRGNFGNYVAQSMGLTSNTLVFEGVRDAANISSWFLLDPTIIGAKALAVVRGLRYGIHLMEAGRVEKTLASRAVGGVETNKVRIYFDNFGRRLKKANEIADPIKRSAALRSLEKVEKKYLTPEVIDGMRKAGVFSADDAIRFFQDADNVTQLLRGQPFHRGYQMYAPHAGYAREVMKEASLKVRGLDPTMRAGRGGIMSVDAAMDAAAAAAGLDNLLVDADGAAVAFTSLPNNTQIEVLKQVMLDAKGSEVLGKNLSDFTGKNTLMGKLVRQLPDEILDNSRFGLQAKGWKRRKSLTARMDRWSRLMARVPDTRMGISIEDSSSAETIYQEMRRAGVPRYWATYMRQVWIDGSEGQRRLILAGLNRTNAYAAGVHLVAGEEGIDNVVKLVTALKPGDRYAANMVPGSARMMEEARAEAEQVLSGRMEMPTEELPRTFIDDLMDERVRLDGEIASVNSSWDEAAIRADAEASAARSADNQYDIATTGESIPDYTATDLGLNVRRGRNAGQVSPAAQRMWDKGYVPKWWVQMWQKTPAEREAMGLPAWGSDEAAAWWQTGNPENARTDSWVVPDWARAAEEATTVEGGGRSLWVEVPFRREQIAGRQSAIDNLVEEQRAAFEAEIDNLTRMRTEVDDAITAERQNGNIPLSERPTPGAQAAGYTDDELIALTREIWAQKIKDAGYRNPSMEDDVTNAVFLGQTTGRVFYPSITQLDAITARSSYLNALLGNNVVVQNLTDLWVFATLAGPRFQIRNIFEDYGFYFGTRGKLFGEGGFRQGRRAAQGKRQALEIQNPKVGAAQKQIAEREEAYARIKEDPTATPQDVQLALDELNEAQEVFADVLHSSAVKTQKLGIVKQNMRRAATAASKSKWFNDMPDTWQDFIRATIHPYLSPDEIRKASTLYREGNRAALGALLAKAYVRERFIYVPKLTPGGANIRSVQAWIKARNGDTSQLSEADQRVVEWLDQFAQGRNGFVFNDLAAEESRHLLDGTMPALSDMKDTTVIGGEMLQRIFIEGKWVTRTSSTSARSVDATWHTLTMALQGDGPKTQYAMYLLGKSDGWMTANTEQRAAIVEDLAAFIVGAPDVYGYMRKFSIVDDNDARRLARSTLETLEGVFTTKEGKFNLDLYNALRRVDDGYEMPNFKLWDKDGDGEYLYRVTKDDFKEGKYEMPSTYLTFDGTSVYAPVGGGEIMGWAWNAMGRSMARLSREPIFMANYIDARKTFQPFEKMWKEAYGEDWWKVADDAATERAYMLTVGYVDNPAVRTQLAWQVRNVARFYRALEDFNRRIWRVVNNNPMMLYKAALIYNMQDSSGYIHKDEFGDEYFIYPGTRPVFEAVNGFMNLTNIGGVQSPSLPLSFAGKTSWLTPSADPDSWTPTLSGWYSSIALRGLYRALPMADALAKGLAGVNTNDAFKRIGEQAEVETFGPIGAQQTLFETILPSHVKRIWELYTASVADPDELAAMSNGVVATSARAAIQAYTAAGLIPTDKALSADERKRLLQRIDGATVGILVTKLVLGFFLPAAPQLRQDDVDEFARLMGVPSLRSGFKQLLSKMPYEKAIVTWYTANPDLAPYVLSQSGDRENVGYWQQTQETVDWIKANKDVVESNVIGASLLAPRFDDAVTTLASYNFLSNQGLLPKAQVGKYLDDMSTQSGYVLYQIGQQQYNDQLSEINSRAMSDEQRKAATDDLELKWRRMRETLYATYQGLEARTGATGAQDYETTIDSIRGAATTLAGRGDRRAQDVVEIFNAYDEARTVVRGGLVGDPGYEEAIGSVREKWKALAIEWNSYYDGDDQFNQILRIMSGALGFKIEEL